MTRKTELFHIIESSVLLQFHTVHLICLLTPCLVNGRPSLSTLTSFIAAFYMVFKSLSSLLFFSVSSATCLSLYPHILVPLILAETWLLFFSFFLISLCAPCRGITPLLHVVVKALLLLSLFSSSCFFHGLKKLFSILMHVLCLCRCR